MVKLMLQFKAELENVTEVEPADKAGYTWTFKVQCSSCREIHENWIGFSRSDDVEISGSRGTANFVWRCAFCKRESTASFAEPNKPALAPYSADDASSHKFGTLCVIECRGCEMVEFDPKGIWKCRGADSGAPFDEVEFEDGVWTDYDEKAGQPVGITEIETKIQRA